MVGGDHCCVPTKYMVFDAATNAWSDRAAFPGTPGHVYDHGAIDPGTGTFYLREYGIHPGGNKVYVYPAGGPWSLKSTWPIGAYVNVALGTTWWNGQMSGVGSQGAFMVYNCGGSEVLIFDPASNTWLRSTSAPAGASTYHCFMEYSPAFNVAILGGGNGNPRKVWRLNADRSLTAMPDAPVNLGVQRANVTVDPATGKFLVLGYGQFWEFDPRGSGQWVQLPASRRPPAGVGDPAALDSVVSSSLSNLGVTMYVGCRGGACKMFLYKHAAGGS
jgi:hypothetical protein